MVQGKRIQLGPMRLRVQSLALLSYGSSVAMSCGAGCRHSSDLALLRPCCRPAAVAPIGPLAREPPYAAGVAQKRKKKKKAKPKQNIISSIPQSVCWKV